MKRLLAATALFVVCFARRTEAQSLGGVRLSLGDAETATVTRLRQKFSLTTAGSGFWSVSDTTKWNGAPDYGNVGFVQFRSGALTSVNKSWREMPSSTVGATEYTLALLRQLSGERDCEVKTPRYDDPEFQSDITAVECTSSSGVVHSVSISVSAQKGGKSVQLNESWIRSSRSR